MAEKLSRREDKIFLNVYIEVTGLLFDTALDTALIYSSYLLSEHLKFILDPLLILFCSNTALR